MSCSKFPPPACFATPGCAVSSPITSQCLGPTGMAECLGMWGAAGASLQHLVARGQGMTIPTSPACVGKERDWHFRQILRGFARVRGKVCADFSPALNAAQRCSIPSLRRSFPRSLAWLCSLRHTSTTRNICPSFMQSVSITNNYLSSSFFLLCWLQS